MNTKCYCVYCPKHPLFNQRHDLNFPVGWYVGKMIWNPEEQKSGADVNCLEPDSPAFSELYIEPNHYDFSITAYGDGTSQTGFDGDGFSVAAYCSNEEYVE